MSQSPPPATDLPAPEVIFKGDSHAAKLAKFVPEMQTPPPPGPQSLSNLACVLQARKVSTSDIQLVQNLIERCLQMYLSQREVVATLHSQAKIEPGFTGLVWQVQPPPPFPPSSHAAAGDMALSDLRHADSVTCAMRVTPSHVFCSVLRPKHAMGIAC